MLFIFYKGGEGAGGGRLSVPNLTCCSSFFLSFFGTFPFEGKVSNVQFQKYIFPSFQFSHRGAVLVLVLEGGAFEVQMKSPHSHPTMLASRVALLIMMMIQQVLPGCFFGWSMCFSEWIKISLKITTHVFESWLQYKMEMYPSVPGCQTIYDTLPKRR